MRQVKDVQGAQREGEVFVGGCELSAEAFPFAACSPLGKMLGWRLVEENVEGVLQGGLDVCGLAAFGLGSEGVRT